MYRVRIAVLFLIAFSMMASSADAQRRRAVGARGEPIVAPPKVVELVAPVFYYNDPEGSGDQVVRVMAQSHFPMVAGTTFTGYVQKPQTTTWRWLVSSTVAPDVEGWFKLLYLYVGVDFYDETETGVRQYWSPGVATFKVEIQDPNGLVTSVRTNVLVPSPGTRIAAQFPLGPVQKVVASADGKSALLVGAFLGKPTAYWYFEKNPGVFYRFPAEMAPDYTIPVPPEISGTSSHLVTCFGYPDSECWTMLVDLPAVVND